MALNPVLNASSVRMLMTPINSPVIGSTLCNLTGALYPMYATFKALEAKTKELPEKQAEKTVAPEKDVELRRWVCYWIAFGGLRCVETFSDPLLFWLPYYYPTKFCVLLWFMLPQFKGSSFVYAKYIKPVFEKYRPKLDAILAEVAKHEWIIEAQMPYFKMLAASLYVMQRNVREWLKWFFSDKIEVEMHSEASDEA